MTKKLSKSAKDCISRAIKRHCKAKRSHCRGAAERKQAVAIGFSKCRRKGFRPIPPKP